MRKGIFLLLLLGFLIFAYYMFFYGFRNYNDLISKQIPDEFTLHEYKDGTLRKEIKIDKKSYLYSLLLKLLASKDIVWKKNYNTYAPSKIFISKNLNINFLDKIIVVNVKINDKGWIQIISNIDSDFQAILNDDKNTK